MNMIIKKSSAANKGFTLIEILVTVAFMALAYSFVAQLFFSGFNSISIGDVRNEGVRLARNEMVRLSSIENPLYIRLLTLPNGPKLIEDLKAGKIAPIDLVNDGTIPLNEVQQVGDLETKENTDEIAKANSGFIYTRKVEWMVEDVEPVLINIKITVSWEDPRQQIKSDDFILETKLTN